MRFAAFLGTKDEADVLPVVVEQLRAIGVELIVVSDVQSTDGTLDYLAEAEAAGDIFVFHDRQGADFGGAAAAALVRAIEADWVLFLDSDEVPLPRHGSLHDLVGLEELDIVAVPRYNVVLGPDGPHLPPALETKRYEHILLYAQPIPDFYYHMQREPETPWIRGVLEPKVLVRPEAVGRLQAGSHDVDGATQRRWRRGVSHDLLLAHLPFRNLERFEMRAANVREVVDGAPGKYSGWNSWQWQRFATMDREGRTREEYDRQVVDANELADLRTTRIVRTAAEVFRDPLTAAGSDEEWMAMAARAEPWLTATSLASEREGIQPEGKLEHVSGSGQYPVVTLPHDHVVKFYGPWRRGPEIMQREVEVLRALEADGGLPVPRLRGSGHLGSDLQYVVMTKIEGIPLDTIRYQLDAAERASVATWSGDFLRRLHAIPLSEADRARGWDTFAEVVAWRYGQVVDLARRRGFAGSLVARLERWMPSIESLMGDAANAVLCHGDLNAGNLIGRPTEPQFDIKGVIDFNQSFVGSPLADIGAIWWGVLQRDVEALKVFLASSGLREHSGDDLPRHALAWVLMTPFWTSAGLDDVAHIADPDELAERWFGGSAQASTVASSS